MARAATGRRVAAARRAGARSADAEDSRGGRGARGRRDANSAVWVAPERALGEITPGLGETTRGQVAEIQRSRLLAGAIGAVAELGYEGVTVAHITSRSRVSRRTFYELFANCEECMAAVLVDIVGLIEAEIARAGLQECDWRERVRRGLWTILCFFDREPELAKVCMVQAAHGGPRMAQRREEIMRVLAAILDEGRVQSARGGGCTELTAEGLVGATLAIVQTRLLRREREPLGLLLGELMGMIVLPYLGPAAARREQARTAPVAQGEGSVSEPAMLAWAGGDPLDGVEMRLTYRTARVLEGVAERPGASNREIAEHADIQDQGQVSKLLARLERLGLLANAGEGRPKGEPNAWSLTAKGRRIAAGIRAHARTAPEAA
jgi:AcrR family transcriptional regulator